MAIEDLCREAESLSKEQRAILAERILASLDAAEIGELWKDEAVRRRELIWQGAENSLPAKEVYGEIDRILGR